MICVGSRPFVSNRMEVGERRGARGDRGMMSSQVTAGSGPGPVAAGMVLPLGFGARKSRWRWNDVEEECV